MRLICATAQKASNTTALERRMILEGIEYEFNRSKNHLIEMGMIPN
jgi:hypothetical protein